MSARYTRFPVSDAGGMAVHLPIADLGPGPPRMAVVAGIHGDEPSPLLLVDRFVAALDGHALTGGIRVLAAANPPALMQRTRWSNWDDEDMNRVGDGGGEPALTRRLAAAVCDAVAGCRLCVNLHNFVMRTPLLAIDPPGLQGERRARHERYLEALDPHVVWVFGDAPEDVRVFSSSLDAALERRGVDALAVEMSDLPELDEPLLARAIAGLMRLAAVAGCLEATERPLKRTTVRVRRRLLRAPGAGVFEPVAPLGAKVDADDVVGELIPLERPGDRVQVRAPAGGWLIQRLGRRFVRPGDMIAAVGLPPE
ncbi:MAG: succinylglutamate desuccinylase/aspartoacylase family protein [Myxococcota bacterium]